MVFNMTGKNENVWLTNEIREVVIEKAKALGLHKSAYLRMLIIQKLNE